MVCYLKAMLNINRTSGVRCCNGPARMSVATSVCGSLWMSSTKMEMILLSFMARLVIKILLCSKQYFNTLTANYGTEGWTLLR